MLLSPFEQFRIVIISSLNSDNYNVILTNSLLNLIIIIFLFQLFSYILLIQRRKKYELPFFSIVLQKLYIFFFDIVLTYTGKNVNRFFPFMFYTFLFIFVCNFVGLFPYSFTVTSHFVVTFGLSYTMWFAIFLLGLSKWDLKYFSLFFPKGMSIALVIGLSLLETISNVFRMFSLALRLLANMIAGHILLDCLSYLIYKTLYSSISLSSVSIFSIIVLILPSIAFMGLLTFEVGVCILQAYIFIVLSCIYVKEIL